MNGKLIKIAKRIDEAGGKLYIVGGAIRDHFMGRKPKDIDLMVCGITTNEAKSIFALFSSEKPENVIGNAPVFMVKINGKAIEVAMARVEVDTNPGKSGFSFKAHPSITVEDDLVRRDFSVNCMAKDVLTGEIIDLFGGQEDIKNKVLTAVSPKFKESPERVLRAMQQAARFDFVVAPETIEFCREMKQHFHTIHVNQIWRHFEKFIMGAIAPERGIQVIVASGWNEFFPEIEKADTSMMETGEVVVSLVAMVKKMENPKRFLSKIGCPPKIMKKVLGMVSANPPDLSEEGVRRLSVAMDKIGMTICNFAHMFPESNVLQLAEEMGLADKAVEPIVTGKILISRGMKPGKEMGKVLAQAFEMQLKGEIENIGDWDERIT